MTVEELNERFPRVQFDTVEVYRAWAYTHWPQDEPIQVVDKGWLIQIPDFEFTTDEVRAMIVNLYKAIQYCDDNP